jgi:repressor LexA
MSKQLTKRQKEVLDFVSEFSEANGYAPTLDEIAARFEISKATASEHIASLVQKDRLKRDRYRQRSLQIAAEPAVVRDDSPPPGPNRNTEARDLEHVRVLGRVAAGRPIEEVVDEEPQSLLSLLPTGGCFSLEVRGDSMVEDGIHDGDFIILEPRLEPRNGETVVAVIDGHEVTLKRWRRIGREVRLEPRNPAYETRVLDLSRVAVRGVLVGLLRRY